MLLHTITSAYFFQLWYGMILLHIFAVRVTFWTMLACLAFASQINVYLGMHVCFTFLFFFLLTLWCCSSCFAGLDILVLALEGLGFMPPPLLFLPSLYLFVFVFRGVRFMSPFSFSCSFSLCFLHYEE